VTRILAAFAILGTSLLFGAGYDTLAARGNGHLSYNEVTLSGGTGSYGPWFGGTERHRYYQAGVGIARTEHRDRFSRIGFGLEGFLYDSNPNYSGGAGMVGFRALVAGESRWVAFEASAQFVADGYSQVEPGGRLRLGPSDVVYAEVAVFSHEIERLPVVELGFGTSHWEWGSVLAGLCEQGVFVAPEIHTNSGLSFSPFVAYGSRDVWQLSLRLRYSFSDFLGRPLRLGEY
jgi:hypothetical protein